MWSSKPFLKALTLRDTISHLGLELHLCIPLSPAWLALDLPSYSKVCILNLEARERASEPTKRSPAMDQMQTLSTETRLGFT